MTNVTRKILFTTAEPIRKGQRFGVGVDRKVHVYRPGMRISGTATQDVPANAPLYLELPKTGFAEI